MIGWTKLLLKGILWDFVLLIEDGFPTPDCAPCPGSIWILRYLRGAGNSERPGMGTGMIRGYRRSNENDERLARKRGDRGDQRWAFFDPLLPRYLPSKAGPREAAKNTENFSNLSTLFFPPSSRLSISAYFLQERTSFSLGWLVRSHSRLPIQPSIRKCASVLWLQIPSDAKGLKRWNTRTN